MGFFFTSTACHPPATLYMGRDKFENDEMLWHANPQDIWFHVDGLSSAHVYLQPHPEWTKNKQTNKLQKEDANNRINSVLDGIPENVLLDCCQLVKYNSIEGKLHRWKISPKSLSFKIFMFLY